MPVLITVQVAVNGFPAGISPFGGGYLPTPEHDHGFPVDGIGFGVLVGVLEDWPNKLMLGVGLLLTGSTPIGKVDSISAKKNVDVEVGV